MARTQADFHNRMLSSLSSADFTLIAPHLEHVILPVGFTLVETGQPIEFVYFLEAGIASVVTDSTGTALEVGIYGREGLSGSSLLLGSDRTPHRHFMQLAGHGNRVNSERLFAAVASSTTLQGALLRFVHTFMLQVTTTAISNATFTIEERLARWLLMCDDRVDGHQFPITHQFLSMMLGVQRAGVTNALNALAGAQLISAQRQLIQIKNREGLINLAKGAYGVSELEYIRLLGPF